MKFIITSFLLFTINGYAQIETSQPKTEDSVETIVKKVKKDRKRKVEMCHECGKPEEQCDCKGEEHKKSK